MKDTKHSLVHINYDTWLGIPKKFLLYWGQKCPWKGASFFIDTVFLGFFFPNSDSCLNSVSQTSFIYFYFIWNFQSRMVQFLTVYEFYIHKCQVHHIWQTQFFRSLIWVILLFVFSWVRVLLDGILKWLRSFFCFMKSMSLCIKIAKILQTHSEFNFVLLVTDITWDYLLELRHFLFQDTWYYPKILSWNLTSFFIFCSILHSSYNISYRITN